nr:MAG TPA: hypothetical protein [Caudoviricetes sp.]
MFSFRSGIPSIPLSSIVSFLPLSSLWSSQFLLTC